MPASTRCSRQRLHRASDTAVVDGCSASETISIGWATHTNRGQTKQASKTGIISPVVAFSHPQSSQCLSSRLGPPQQHQWKLSSATIVLLRLHARCPLPASPPPSGASFRPRRIELKAFRLSWFFRINLFTGVPCDLSAFYPRLADFKSEKLLWSSIATHPAHRPLDCCSHHHRLVRHSNSIRVHNNISPYVELLRVSHRGRHMVLPGVALRSVFLG